MPEQPKENQPPRLQPVELSPPLFEVREPDLGPEIKDLPKHIENATKGKRIVIIYDGHHFSLNAQTKMREVIKTIKPETAALELTVALDTPTEANILEQIQKLKQEMTDKKKLTPLLASIMDENATLIKDLKADKVKIEFIDKRTVAEKTATMEVIRKFNEVEDLTLGVMPTEQTRKLRKEGQEAMEQYNKLNKKMEISVAADVKKLYDNSKGTIVLVVGENHGESVTEELVKLGVPKEQIASINIKAARDVPKKHMQAGGLRGAGTTIFVYDQDGSPHIAMGGIPVSEGFILEKKNLGKIEGIEFSGRPNNKTAQYIGLKIVLDKNDNLLGSLNIPDIGVVGMEKALVQKIIIKHGVDKERQTVEVDITGLPMKLPGEKLTPAEEKLWTDRLQKGIDELRKKVEAKEKEKEPEQPKAPTTGALPTPKTPAAAALPETRER